MNTMPLSIFLVLTLTAAEPARFSVGVGQEVGFRVQSEWVRGNADVSFRLSNGERSMALYPRAPVALRSRGARSIEPDEEK